MQSGLTSYGTVATSYGSLPTDSFYQLNGSTGSTVIKNLEITGNLKVDGLTDLSGVVTMGSDAQITGILLVGGEISADGTIFANKATGNALVVGAGGDLVVQGGGSIQSSGLTHTGSLSVDTDATITGLTTTNGFRTTYFGMDNRVGTAADPVAFAVSAPYNQLGTSGVLQIFAPNGSAYIGGNYLMPVGTTPASQIFLTCFSAPASGDASAIIGGARATVFLNGSLQNEVSIRMSCSTLAADTSFLVSYFVVI